MAVKNDGGSLSYGTVAKMIGGMLAGVVAWAVTSPPTPTDGSSQTAGQQDLAFEMARRFLKLPTNGNFTEDQFRKAIRRRRADLHPDRWNGSQTMDELSREIVEYGRVIAHKRGWAAP